MSLCLEDVKYILDPDTPEHYISEHYMKRHVPHPDRWQLKSVHIQQHNVRRINHAVDSQTPTHNAGRTALLAKPSKLKHDK